MMDPQGYTTYMNAAGMPMSLTSLNNDLTHTSQLSRLLDSRLRRYTITRSMRLYIVATGMATHIPCTNVLSFVISK